MSPLSAISARPSLFALDRPRFASTIVITAPEAFKKVVTPEVAFVEKRVAELLSQSTRSVSSKGSVPSSINSLLQ